MSNAKKSEKSVPTAADVGANAAPGAAPGAAAATDPIGGDPTDPIGGDPTAVGPVVPTGGNAEESVSVIATLPPVVEAGKEEKPAALRTTITRIVTGSGKTEKVIDSGVVHLFESEIDAIEMTAMNAARLPTDSEFLAWKLSKGL